MDSYYYMSKEPFLDGGVPIFLSDVFEATLNIYYKLRNIILLEIHNLEKSNVNDSNNVEILKRVRMVKQIEEQINDTVSQMHNTSIADLTCAIEIDYPDGRVSKVPYYVSEFKQ